MKITSIQDITDENLKVVEASAVSEFIEDELKKASENYSDEKAKLENALSEASEKHESLLKEHSGAKEQLEKIQAQLGEMLAEKAQREAEERFATRMTSLDESFVLEDQEREIIASDIKDMTDEQFASHIEKLDVLLKSRKREVVEAMERQQAEEAKASDEEVKEEASAETVVEEVVENAESQDEEVPNTIEASEPTVFDKYKSAFSVDQFEIK
jgi:chromosome segregation ATPase